MIASKLLLAAMATVGLAFDVTVWENPDCTGASRDINVYDNTCSTPSPGWAAVTVNAYGAHRQQATFYEDDECIGPSLASYWADGGGTTFVKGNCISMLGEIASAMGSAAGT